MRALLRHMVPILLMPFMVVVAVPLWLLTAFADLDRRVSGNSLMFEIVGGIVITSGLALFTWCVSLFARIGKGTLAPWDPTRSLVGVGPYRVVRNPMILGVALMLFGQALFRGSLVLGLWCCVFILINHVYFVLSEEPGLVKRFGKDYIAYKEHVPRWVPRLRRLPDRNNTNPTRQG